MDRAKVKTQYRQPHLAVPRPVPARAAPAKKLTLSRIQFGPKLFHSPAQALVFPSAQPSSGLSRFGRSPPAAAAAVNSEVAKSLEKQIEELKARNEHVKKVGVSGNNSLR